MYEEVDLLLIAILALFPTWIAHFNKILDRYETYQKEKMECRVVPTTDKLKMAVYAAEKLGFDFSRDNKSNTLFTRYCRADCWTIVSPSYRIVKNLDKFFYSGALFEDTTNVVLHKMIETFILYQLLESPFGKLLKCVEEYEKISILSGYDDKDPHVLGELSIRHNNIKFQHCDCYKRKTSDVMNFDSIHAFVNDKDIQEYIFGKQIGEINFSEISCQMVEKIREFVDLLSPIVRKTQILQQTGITINMPRLIKNLRHTERVKKVQKENSKFYIKQHKSDAKFMRALILYTYMTNVKFEHIRENVFLFICQMQKTRAFPRGYINDIVDYAELFYQGKFVINANIRENRYFREIELANSKIS